MRGAVVLIVSVAAAALAMPPERGGPLYLRVEDNAGVVHAGRARYKKTNIEVDTARGMKRILYSSMKSIEQYDPDDPPPESERPIDLAEFEKRAKALEDKNEKAEEKRDEEKKEGDPPAADAPPADPARKAGQAWSRLGVWAKKRGLDAEAKRAFEKAIELLPDDDDARKGLGQAKDDDGAWKDVNVIFAKKREKAKERTSIFELVKWCARHGLDGEVLGLLFPLSQKDAYDKGVLQALRPVTDRKRQVTRLAFPVRGTWRVSEDRTHHHELKTFAIYAVDLYGEVDGRPWKGSGDALEDHYCWGAPIYSSADGTVVEVREGFPDNPVNKLEGMAEKHNGVYIMHENGESSWYLHTMKGTITVKKGDTVKRGDLIAKVGNSGGSAQPHLHYTLCDARTAISIPWRCDDYWLLTVEGKVKVKRGRPMEGQLVEVDEPPQAEKK